LLAPHDLTADIRCICVQDHLPVAHRLPSPSDERTFHLVLDARGVRSNVSFQYTGNGGYDALLTVQTYGLFELSLWLDSRAVPLSGVAVCSLDADKLPALGGTCVCAAGYEPGDDRCIACAADKHKPEPGNMLCTERPIEVQPYAQQRSLSLYSIAPWPVDALKPLLSPPYSCGRLRLEAPLSS
jgi:hypothetical protein